MQFSKSNSLAAHLGGGRGSQGGVSVTEGPKVSGFQGFGEGNPKLLDTVTGETLTAPPGAIPSPPPNCLNLHCRPSGRSIQPLVRAAPTAPLPTNSAIDPKLSPAGL